MEDLNLEGIFWLPSVSESSVAGRLTFNVAEGAELSLIGSLEGVESLLSNDDQESRRIMGVAGKRLLTLEGCVKAGSNMEMPGILRDRYRVKQIFSGVHFANEDSLEFIEVSFEVRHLAYWVGRSAITWSMTEHQASKRISNVSVDLDPLEPSSFQAGVGDLELGFSWGMFGDDVLEKGVRHRTYLSFKPTAKRLLDDLLKVCMAVQHLVTVGVDAAAPIEALTLKHEKHTRQIGSKTINEPIELYAQLQGADSPGAEKRILPHEMLFTFDDLGGLEGLSRWLGVADKFEPVIGTLLAHRYISRTYMENRLQNAVFAAETFDRLRFPNRVQSHKVHKAKVDSIIAAAPEDHQKWLREQLAFSNEPRLIDRLVRLAQHAGPTFETLVSDPGEWAKATKDARNRTVHRGRRGKQLDGASLFSLAESVYFLVCLCLLRESGVSEEDLRKVQTHRRFGWLRERLQDHLQSG